MANRRDGEETRGRILAVACEVFAEQGYRGATNAEICRRSEVNGAAINYHFHSKEALYVEAFKTALEESLKAHPIGGDAMADSSPEMRLKSMIRATIRRISDPSNRSFEMLRKEMNESTGLLMDTMHQFIMDEQSLMEKLVGDVLGSSVPPEKVKLCAMSVLAQCVHPAIHERHRFEDGKEPMMPEVRFDVDGIAEHVFSFSMAAFASIGRQA